MTKNRNVEFSERLRKAAEKKLKHSVVPLRSDSKFAKVVEEVHIHQVELETQNEQLREVQVELEKSRNKYSELFDFAPVGYFILNERGTILEMNMTGASLLNLERDKLIKDSLTHFVKKEDRDVLYLHFRQVFKDARKAQCELRLIKEDDSTIHAQLISEPIKDSKSNVINCRTAVTDITKLKQIEDDLRLTSNELEARVEDRTRELNDAVILLQDEIEKSRRIQNKLTKSEERYRSLIIASAQIIWIVNPRGEILEECPTWGKFTGQKFNQYKGFGWLDAIHPDDLENLKQEISEGVKNPKICEVQLRLLRHDGQYRDIWSKAVPIFEKDGTIREWIGACVDITEHKETEEKIRRDGLRLRNLTTELVLAEEREKRMIAEEMHDSIGPLLAFSSRELENIIKEIPLEPLKKIKQYIDEIFTKTRSMQFDLSPASLYDIGLEFAVEELAEQFENEHKIKVYFRNCPHPKPLTDETKVLLYRSIRELLVNAAKHSKANVIHIKLAKINDEIEIKIIDNGIGFDIETLESKPAKSKGLGLFSIKERVTQLGGKFNMESKPQKGTKITLTAPLKT